MPLASMTRWTCNEDNCNKTFQRRYHLLRHKENVHTASRPHTCHVCYRAFARKDALLRHERFHAENPSWSGSRTVRPSTRCESDDEDNDTNMSCEDDSGPIDHPIPLIAEPPNSTTTNVTVNQVRDANSHQPAPDASTPLIMEHTAASNWESLTPRTTNSSMDVGGEGRTVDVSIVTHERNGMSLLHDQSRATSIPMMLNLNDDNLSQGDYFFLADSSSKSHSSYPHDSDEILDSIQDFIPLEHCEELLILRHEPFLQLYFANTHHQWSLVHEGVFWKRKPPTLLECAMGFIGLLMRPSIDPSLLRTARSVTSWLRGILRQRFQQTAPSREHPPIAAYQIYFLTMLFAFYLKDASEIAETRSHVATLVDQIRRANLTDFELIAAQDDKMASQFSRWVVREEKQRLVFSTFRLDTFLQIIDDLPPSMRFQELCLPFPCTDKAWNSSEEGWKEAISHEPSNRTSSTYGIQCVLAMSRLSPSSRLNLPGFRTIYDFELGLVSMQSRLWEETQHPTSSFDGFTSGVEGSDLPSSEGYGQSWPVLWGIWHVTMERLRSSHEDYCPHPSGKEIYLTSLLLYHASLLRVYVDMKVLRRLVVLLVRNPSSTPIKRQLERQVHDWVKSARSKDALWHAAQILRLYSKDLPELRAQNIPINPVAVNCLFRAALVVWAISRSSQNCGLCAPASTSFEKARSSTGLRPRASSSGSLELTRIDNLSKKYELWLEDSDGELLVDGVTVCACQMATLVDKFRSQIEDTFLGSSEIESYADTLDCLKLHA